MRFALLLLKKIDLTSFTAISESKFFRSSVFSMALIGLLVFTAPAFSMKVVAQANSAPIASVGTGTLKTPVDDARYRIGPGDVLTIIVRKAPELSGTVRVDQR